MWDFLGVSAAVVILFLVNVLLLGLSMLLYGWFCMLLWNWLIPPIFGLTEITFWQGFGLTILSFLFFKATAAKINIDLST